VQSPNLQRYAVGWSHVYQLPAGAAYDVKWMAGHLHIGARNIQLINTTLGGGNNTVVCESRARYGTQPGVAGDEKGFVVDITPCAFDPPLRISGGETYVLR
jgi:hypothetical protein